MERSWLLARAWSTRAVPARNEGSRRRGLGLVAPKALPDTGTCRFARAETETRVLLDNVLQLVSISTQCPNRRKLHDGDDLPARTSITYLRVMGIRRPTRGRPPHGRRELLAWRRIVSPNPFSTTGRTEGTGMGDIPVGCFRGLSALARHWAKRRQTGRDDDGRDHTARERSGPRGTSGMRRSCAGYRGVAVAEEEARKREEFGHWPGLAYKRWHAPRRA